MILFAQIAQVILYFSYGIAHDFILLPRMDEKMHELFFLSINKEKHKDDDDDDAI